MTKPILNSYEDVNRISVKCYRCGNLCGIKWFLNICRKCAEEEYTIKNVKQK